MVASFLRLCLLSVQIESWVIYPVGVDSLSGKKAWLKEMQKRFLSLGT